MGKSRLLSKKIKPRNYQKPKKKINKNKFSIFSHENLART